MIILWLIGSIFTMGVLDPYNKESFWTSLRHFIYWPAELGRHVGKLHKSGDEK